MRILTTHLQSDSLGAPSDALCGATGPLTFADLNDVTCPACCEAALLHRPALVNLVDAKVARALAAVVSVLEGPGPFRRDLLAAEKAQLRHVIHDVLTGDDE